MQMRVGIMMTLTLTGLLAGCGGSSGPKLYPTGGIVNFQSRPLAGARVTFIPEKGAVAMATTDSEGKYQLQTGAESGCVSGNCKVAVVLADHGASNELDKSMTPEDMQRMAMSGTLDAALAKQGKSLIPEHYGLAETSGLTFEVKTDGPNEFIIDLK